ncbi:gamma-glutamylcyclotransferase family protein [Niveibacterium sp. SC-1]|uniref:gamma-glutamylcyclotransferase family protein n=1 Tax=Niveibacterium sp. SC-1 TaxID=3135646 RepID=UPI00311D385D
MREKEEEAPQVFWYFGYGSNMDLVSLRAKGVSPQRSLPARLPGWRLRFNVRHFFRHEGGVGNIEPGGAGDYVLGVLHLCEDATLAPLDDTEAYGHGYDRIEVCVQTEEGELPGLTYVGMPSFLDEACLPTRRYMNILLQGARSAGLDPAYVAMLEQQPLHTRRAVPPFVAPAGAHPMFSAATLADQPLYTALDGQVFDMSAAREQHEFLKGFFGGRDMTLFHLKRLDGSDGSETAEDVRLQRYSPAQRQYLDEYLHEYAHEYRHVGGYRYDES